MTQLEEWQLKEIEDTLRLVSNQFNSPKRELTDVIAFKIMLTFLFSPNCFFNISE